MPWHILLDYSYWSEIKNISEIKYVIDNNRTIYKKGCHICLSNFLAAKWYMFVYSSFKYIQHSDLNCIINRTIANSFLLKNDKNYS